MSGFFLNEMPSEGENVFRMLAQRRYFNGEDVEPVQQVLAEQPFIDHSFKIAIGGGDDSNVRMQNLFAAQSHELFLLQESKQLGLHGRRHIADLVQKLRPLPWRLPPTDLARHGAP